MLPDVLVKLILNLQFKYRLKVIADLVECNIKTVIKYLKIGKLPSEMKKPRNYKTRNCPFEKYWDEIKEKLKMHPKIEAKTIFEELCDKYEGVFKPIQLRTLQKKIKKWRIFEGKRKEVYFPQIHKPGELCESDFTRMNKLEITIEKQTFKHMVYHFCLTYSNWEYVEICQSESFETISRGIQNAIWELGGVPKNHRSDRLSAVFNNLKNRKEIQERFKDLMTHLNINPQVIQAGKANENGDIEKSHDLLKNAVEQALIIRGSRDFKSEEEYEEFLKQIVKKRNLNRKEKLEEEKKELQELPFKQMEPYKKEVFRVTKFSTINVRHNTYSVDSRFIGEKLEVKIKPDFLELFYDDKLVTTIRRLYGSNNHKINYKDIIHSLVRKPGAFENYKYKSDMFPTHNFRMAYDILKKSHELNKANNEYLKILLMATEEGQEKVEKSIIKLFETETEITKEEIEKNMEINNYQPVEVLVDDINLTDYDFLLDNGGTEYDQTFKQERDTEQLFDRSPLADYQKDICRNSS